jgi:GntR family transcriptional regulator
MAKYERIADELRHQIRVGELAAGSQVPTQTSLAEHYRVSLPTIQQALSVLETEGLIDSKHGIGTYVRAPRRQVRRTTDRYQWEKQRALRPDDERRNTGSIEYDTGLVMDDLEFDAKYETVNADADLAQAFDVPLATKLLKRTYRTRIRSEGVAVSLISSYLVYDLVAVNPDLLDASNEPWPGGTFHQLKTINVEIEEITDEITARPPQGEELEILGIGQGVAVLVLRKTSVDTTNRVVEISDVIMPGDRTIMTYKTHLDPWPV